MKAPIKLSWNRKTFDVCAEINIFMMHKTDQKKHKSIKKIIIDDDELDHPPT